MDQRFSYRPLRRPSSLKQIEEHHDHGDHQQDMD
jgi:hypothetical protein